MSKELKEGFCKETVCDGTGWHWNQCSRKALKDGYCKIHHPEYIKQKIEERNRKYEEKMKKESWYLLGEAREEIEKLKEENLKLEEEVSRLSTKLFEMKLDQEQPDNSALEE